MNRSFQSLSLTTPIYPDSYAQSLAARHVSPPTEIRGLTKRKPVETSDYAVQRYYNANYGRFWSPDPDPSANLADPVTWNRYAYVGDGPVNRADPSGTGWICVGYADDCQWVYIPDGAWSGAGSGSVGSGVDPTVPIKSPPTHPSPPVGTDWHRFAAAFYNVVAALAHSECSSIFGTAPTSGSLLGPNPGNTPYQVFAYLYINGDISFGTMVNAGDAAETTYNQTLASELGITTAIPTITISNQTTFPANTPGFWNQGSTTNVTNAVTLLHELGHALADLGWQNDQILDDSNDSGQSLSNQATVRTDCAKYMKY